MPNYLPDTYVGVAFNAEPFDSAGVPVWSDLSSRVVGVDSASRGRSQYELDQNQTGEADLTLYDQDEALNPGNTSSPYSPNVVPYRQLAIQAMWPNGGTGNILGGAGYDGSFESYAVGAGPAWLATLANLAGVSATTVTVVGTGAWQGTKAAQLAITAGATRLGGAQLTLATIPGRQYTAQVHVNQTAATALQLAVAGQTICVDPFTRTTAGGWGTPTYFGPVWTILGTAANMSTSAGLAFMGLSAVNARLAALTAAAGANQFVQDADQWITVTVPVLATGAGINASLWTRYVDPNNNIECLLSFNTSGTVVLQVIKAVAGVFTSIATVTLNDPYVAGDSYRIHSKVVGPDIWVKVWKVTVVVPEPLPWTVQVSDSAVSAPAALGVTGILGAGNTNTLPVMLTFSDYRAVGSAVDTAAGQTSTSGSYVMLTQVFTATQPRHTIQLKTQAAPAGANTVLVDGIQVEPGGTANTFTTTGPVVRPVWTRGYVERWPSQWESDSAGFLGIAAIPAVGPSFLLASTSLHAEYRGALMATAPRYYWPLMETATTTTSFGEQSGNSGPALNRWDAVEGPATTFSPGTSTGVPGNPDGVGLLINGQSLGAPHNGSNIQTGYKTGVALTGLGGSGTSFWGLTASLWLSSTDLLSTGEMLVLETPTNNGSYFLMNTIFTGSNQGPTATLIVPSGAPVGSTAPVGTTTFLDGKPHLYTATVVFSSLNTYAVTMYVDGQPFGTAGTGTTSTTFGTSTPFGAFPAIQVGGESATPGSGSGSSMFNGLSGTYSDVAVWSRALSAAEVAGLYRAGQGYPNENSGTRVARYLSLAGYTGTTNISQGLTTMGASTLQEGDAALAAIQNVQDTEFGYFFESQDGFAFTSRQARYLTTTSAFTFGENVAAGEYPYLGDISYDFDPTYVYNAAVISRTGGVIATAADTTGRSQTRFGTRTFTRTVDGNNDLEAQDAANWVIANYSTPKQRLATLTFDAARTRGLAADDGTLWPMLLKLEIGTRVTVKRRAKAANAGAGTALSGDFFVEAVTHNGINFGAGTWLVTLLLSPIPVASQPWILGDPVYGVLDSTTRLGF